MALRRGLSTAARASAGAGSGAGAGNFASVRVVTYNVLSAHLCSPTSYAFRLRNPEDLKAEVRYARLGTMLQQAALAGLVLVVGAIAFRAPPTLLAAAAYREATGRGGSARFRGMLAGGVHVLGWAPVGLLRAQPVHVRAHQLQRGQVLRLGEQGCS